MAPYDKNSNQRWALDGQKIVNRANTKRCLDISGSDMKDGAKVIPFDYKGGANQHWEIVYV